MGPDQQEWKSKSTGSVEKCVRNGPNVDETAQDGQLTARLTQIGSDPHPSDHDSIQNRATNEIHEDDWAAFPWNTQETEGKQWWWKNPEDDLTDSDEKRVNNEKNIKQTHEEQQERFLHPSRSPPTFPQRTSSPLSQLSICSIGMSSRPEPTRHPSQTFIRLSLHSDNPLPLSIAPEDNEPLGDEDSDFYVIPEVPDILRPGIITASHFTRLESTEDAPAVASFFGYGSTIVLEDGDGRTRVYQGHTLVHLYAPDMPNSAEYPPPPPLERTTAARSAFRQLSSTTNSPTPDPSDSQNPGGGGLVTSVQAIRFNPGSGGTDRSVERRGTPAINPDSTSRASTNRGRELSAAETLVSLRERRTGSHSPDDIKTEPLAPTAPGNARNQDANEQLRANDSLANPATRTKIRFMRGGVLRGTVDIPASPTHPTPCSAAVVRTFCVKTPIIVVKYDIKMVGMISDTKTVGSHLTQKLWEGH